jgi:hypothetical protein
MVGAMAEREQAMWAEHRGMFVWIGFGGMAK